MQVPAKAENDFFNQLTQIVGESYYVFPQMHLSSIFDHTVAGQNWKAAFSYINQKSVDYVICNRQYRRPMLAIELDDWGHDSDARQQRDAHVDQLFKDSGMPLLRVRDVRSMSADDLRAMVTSYLYAPDPQQPSPPHTTTSSPSGL